MGSWEEGKHPRDKGKFSHSAGAGAAAPTKEWADRHLSEKTAAVAQAGRPEGHPLDKHFPMAGTHTDGLLVGDKVKNLGSISATFNEGDYHALPGIREVSMEHFKAAPADMFYAADDHRHVQELAERIKHGGYIDPLIIAVDKKGPYVLEGAHRLSALHELGVKSFPAKVVIEKDGAMPADAEQHAAGQVARSMAWKPVMDKAAAAEWSKGGAFEGVPLYHSTFPEHIDLIRQHGFKDSTDGTFGAGVYFTTNPRESYRGVQGRNVEAAVHVQKVAEVRRGSDLDRLVAQLGEKETNDYRAVLLKHGYDAIVVKRPGGDWVNVLDPKRAVMVEGT